jgi:hypothetical protein
MMITYAATATATTRCAGDSCVGAEQVQRCRGDGAGAGPGAGAGAGRCQAVQKDP